jgi:hypothetical protein
MPGAGLAAAQGGEMTPRTRRLIRALDAIKVLEGRDWR